MMNTKKSSTFLYTHQDVTAYPFFSRVALQTININRKRKLKTLKRINQKMEAGHLFYYKTSNNYRKINFDAYR